MFNDKLDFKAVFRETLTSGLDMWTYGSQHHLQANQSERLTKEVGETRRETVSHDHSYITALVELNQQKSDASSWENLVSGSLSLGYRFIWGT